jgi:hypothetical protein
MDIDVLRKFREDTYIYNVENLEELYNIIFSKYDIRPIYPKLNMKANDLLTCKYCQTLQIHEYKDVLQHLKDCYIYRYTLFNKDVSKEVSKATKQAVKKEQQEQQCDKNLHYRDFHVSLSELSKRTVYDVLENNYTLPDDKSFVYVGEARHWNKQYFKIGKVSSRRLLKSRLVQYNTGRISGMDDFYFLYLFPVDNNDKALELEKKIKEKFREYQVKSSEIYKGLCLENLKKFILTV